MANSTTLTIHLSGDRVALYEEAALLMEQRGHKISRQRVVAAALHLLKDKLETTTAPIDFPYRDQRGDGLRRWKASQTKS